MVHFDAIVELPKEKFIHTSTGNIISRSASISQPQALEVPGGRCFVNDNAEIRADLAPIQLNRFTHIEKNVVLRPAHTIEGTDGSSSRKYIPLTIGSHTIIEEGSIIEAAAIGMGCEIGKNCTISKRVILKDYVKVLNNTVILPDMVIPPLVIVSGNPGKIVGEQPESVTTLTTAHAVDRYKYIQLT